MNELIQILTSKNVNLPQNEAIRYIEHIKTTYKLEHEKAYCRYIINQIAFKTLEIDKIDEDIPRILNTINQFNKIKASKEWHNIISKHYKTDETDKYTNIFNIKSWRTLESLVFSCSSTKTKHTTIKSIKQAWARKIFNHTIKTQDGDIRYEIIECTSPEALNYYGRNTKWCTSGWANRWFTCDKYLSTGPIYIILATCIDVNTSGLLRRKVVPNGKLTPYIQMNADTTEFRNYEDDTLKLMSDSLMDMFTNFAASVATIYKDDTVTTYVPINKLKPNELPIWEDEENEIAVKRELIHNGIVNKLTNGISELLNYYSAKRNRCKQATKLKF